MQFFLSPFKVQYTLLCLIRISRGATNKHNLDFPPVFFVRKFDMSTNTACKLPSSNQKCAEFKEQQVTTCFIYCSNLKVGVHSRVSVIFDMSPTHSRLLIGPQIRDCTTGYLPLPCPLPIASTNKSLQGKDPLAFPLPDQKCLELGNFNKCFSN